MKPKIITIASVKGGVGKTALTAGLADSLSRHGRTVAVDLDSQASLTDYFLRDTPFTEIVNANSYQWLSQRKAPAECLHNAGLSLQIIPATLELQKISIEMAGEPTAILGYRKELQSLDADYILIDTPPSLGYQLSASLFVADVILTPITLDRWNFQGWQMLKSEVEKIAEKVERKINLIATPSIVTPSEAVKLAESLQGQMLTSPIHKQASVKTALTTGAKLKENSKAWLEFEQIVSELVKVA